MHLCYMKLKQLNTILVIDLILISTASKFDLYPGVKGQCQHAALTLCQYECLRPIVATDIVGMDVV